jgi:DNA repair exonuclease SbcCD ATPase subunit
MTTDEIEKRLNEAYGHNRPNEFDLMWLHETVRELAKERDALTGPKACEEGREFCRYRIDALVEERNAVNEQVDRARKAIEELRGESGTWVECIEELAADLEKAQRAFRNLGARIDRDGGHRQAGESIEETAARLDAAVVGLHSDLERAQREAAAMQLVLAHLHGKHRADLEKAQREAAAMRAAIQDFLEDQDEDRVSTFEALRRAIESDAGRDFVPRAELELAQQKLAASEERGRVLLEAKNDIAGGLRAEAERLKARLEAWEENSGIRDARDECERHKRAALESLRERAARKCERVQAEEDGDVNGDWLAELIRGLPLEEEKKP